MSGVFLTHAFTHQEMQDIWEAVSMAAEHADEDEETAGSWDELLKKVETAAKSMPVPTSDPDLLRTAAGKLSGTDDLRDMWRDDDSHIRQVRFIVRRAWPRLADALDAL